MHSFKRDKYPKESLLDFSKSCIEIGDLKTANSTLNRLIKIKDECCRSLLPEGKFNGTS